VQELEAEICVTPDDTLLEHLKDDAVGDVDISFGLWDQTIVPGGQRQARLLPVAIDHVETLYDFSVPLSLSLSQLFQEQLSAIAGIETDHSARQEVQRERLCR
jgi:hypothetical protein